LRAQQKRDRRTDERTNEQKDWDFGTFSPQISETVHTMEPKKIRACGHYWGLLVAFKDLFDWTLSKAARNSRSSKIADFTGAKKVRPSHPAA